MSNQVTVSDTVARTTRTAGQLIPAVVFTDVVDTFIVDLTDRQYGVFLAALTLLISWGQNAIENYRGKGFLREMPPPQVPIIDDGIEDVEGRHEA